MRTTSPDRMRALEEGAAYAELADVRLTLVTGTDARAWLHDLVTTDVESLGRFATRPSLLLTPTGRIRAAFHVLGLGERDLALAQRADQPASIADLLAPYVLSSDVSIEPSRLRLFAVPGGTQPPAWAGDAWRPSVLGAGYDLVVGAGDEEAIDDVRRRLSGSGLAPVDRDAVEALRIAWGDARFPADVGQDSLPAEAGWDAAPVTDRAKGCFLGQEAIAKVANLGHPTRVVVAVEGDRDLRPGEELVADGAGVGAVTSADGSLGIARIRWEARRAALVTASGHAVRRR